MATACSTSTSRSSAARSSASSGPTAPGKSTTMRLLLDLIRPTAGSATVLGLDCRRESLEIRRRVGFLPGDFALYPKLTGEAMLDYLAELRGGVDRGVRDGLAERFDAAARPAGARALDRQPPEARADPGVHARAGAADPRRADRRARPAGAAELPRAAGGGRRGGADRLPLLAHALGGRAGGRPRRDPAARAPRRRRLAREPPRGRRAAAGDRVRRRRAREREELRALPGVREATSTGRI